MKTTLTIILFTLCLNVFAASVPAYYVSSSDPNASDNNAGTSQSAPWKTWQKVAASVASFGAGTQVLFKRGDVFPATTTVTLSAGGSSTAYLTFGAYGTGAKPIISGLTTLTGWTAESGRANVYSITGLTGSSSPKILFMDGQIKTWGRWPNATYNSYGGFIPYGSRSGTTITDANYGTLTNRPDDNWLGAKIVQRATHFSVDCPVITSNSLSSNTMTYSWSVLDSKGKETKSLYYNMNNATYCLMDHISTLDLQGEWCYNSGSDKISIYSTNAPSNHTIQVAIIDKIIDLNSKSYVTITDLFFTGCNDKAITGGSGHFQDVKNCSITYCGNYAMLFSGSDHVIDNNYVNYCLSMGIKASGGNATITNNNINNILPVQGMNSGGQQGDGIQTVGSNVWIQYNTLTNIGGSAILFDEGSNIFIQYNFIDKGMTQMDDVGIIYTVNQMYDLTRRNRRITNNILINCLNLSAAVGLPNSWYNGSGIIQNAIYGDQYTNHTIWKDNIVVDARMGAYFNDPFYDTLSGNIFYNFSSNAVANTYSKGNGIWLHNNKQPVGTYKIQGGVNDGSYIPTFTPFANQVNDNLFFSNYSGTSPAAAQKFVSGTHGDTTDARYVATVDRNVYAYPLAQSNTNYFSATGSGGSSLTNWRSLGFDPSGTVYNIAVPSGTTSASVSRLIYNNNKQDSTVTLGGIKYIDAKTKKTYQGSITLTPFTGMVLIANGAATTGTAPTVSITSPANKSTYSQPLNLTISASASDADGTVSSVDFYNGSTKLGSDNTSPYSYTWNSVPAGNPIVITAVATDNSGLSTTSKTDTIIVAAVNVKPTISIDTPFNNAVYIAKADIRMFASANDTDGTISKVDFYNGKKLIHSETTSPYQWTWLGIDTGSYSITARAFDNSGDSTTSAAVNIAVKNLVAPNVSITSPTNNQAYVEPASITINASASDVDGTVKKVEFYKNGVLMNTDLTTPYSYTMTNIYKGTDTLMAKAYDNDGLTTTSSVVTITNAPVKKFPAVSLTAPTNNATYTDPASIVISATAKDTDGTIAYVSFYANNSLVGTDFTAPYSITYSSVMKGTYSLTAVAKDNDSLSTTSTARSVTVTHTNVAPTISIIEPIDSSEVGALINFTAGANDNDGTVTKVEFYSGTTLIGTVTSAPYSIQLNLAAGTYTLTAKATDNNGATTSTSISYKVYNPSPTAPIRIRGRAVIK
jgi:hypothetical protein